MITIHCTVKDIKARGRGSCGKCPAGSDRASPGMRHSASVAYIFLYHTVSKLMYCLVVLAYSVICQNVQRWSFLPLALDLGEDHK